MPWEMNQNNTRGETNATLSLWFSGCSIMKKTWTPERLKSTEGSREEAIEASTACKDRNTSMRRERRKRKIKKD
jgi:hypothetical protein